MKFKIIVLSLLTLFFSNKNINAKIPIPIPYSNGPKIVFAKQLPNEKKYQIQASDGSWHHADIGIMFNQYSIFFIPLYNYGGAKYVLFSNNDIDGTTYSEEGGNAVIAELNFNGVHLPDPPKLPFWDETGGKLVWASIIIVICLYFAFKRSEEDE